MRIDAIHIENFLSFDTFAWQELDPSLNVLVGPNGAGKTNLVNALRAMQFVVRRSAASSPLESNEAGIAGWMWEHVGHRGDDTRPIRIAVDLALTTDWESQVLATFVAAALFHPHSIQEIGIRERTPTVTPDGMRAFANWLEQQILPAISWLLEGRLVITSSDGGRYWDCQYEGRGNGTPFWWDLHGPGIRGERTPSSTGVSSLYEAWRGQLSADVRQQFDRALAGEPEGEFPAALHLDDLPQWAGAALAKPLGAEAWNWPSPSPRLSQHLERFIPSPRPGWNTTGGQVWRLLLDTALVFTDNVRQQPRTLYSTHELQDKPLDLSNGRDLAAFLRAKKVGGAPARAGYEQIQEMFRRLTGRRFEVLETMGGETAATVITTSTGTQSIEDSSQVMLKLVVAEPWGDVPLNFSGAGIAEALYVSTMIAGSAGQVVALDEPSLNLHPTLQTTLLDAILRHAEGTRQQVMGRSQFLVSTHSPWLVPADAIERVARFTPTEGGTTVHTTHSSARGTHTEDELVELRNLLRGSPGARALLFSRGVLLVEGETELGALPVWWDLERRDVALYSVGGKGNFVGPIKFLERFSIPWAALCDGDALWDRKRHGKGHSPEDHMTAIVRASGKKLRKVLANPGAGSSDFARWQKRLERFGIFSLASTPDDGFERAIQAHTPSAVWIEAHNQFNDNKVACGRYVSEHCPAPTVVTRMLSRVLKHLRICGADLDMPLG